MSRMILNVTWNSTIEGVSVDNGHWNGYAFPVLRIVTHLRSKRSQRTQIQEMEYNIYESCHCPFPRLRNQALAFRLEGSTLQRPVRDETLM